MSDVAMTKMSDLVSSFDTKTNNQELTAGIIEALKEDKVIKVSNTQLQETENILMTVCKAFSLDESLSMQVSFASIHGHRRKSSQYFMTVNERKGYQFIPFHSEGTSKAGMQIASMHCCENSTDGGVSVLSHVRQDPELWRQQKEYCIKVDLGPLQPSRQQVEFIKGMYNIDILKDRLSPEDTILSEVNLSQLGINTQNGFNIKAYNVLCSLKPSYSKILERSIYAYWDSVASYDRASADAYYQLLENLDLLRKPPYGTDLEHVDNAFNRRVWDSKTDCLTLFDGHLAVDLEPNECVIFNNMSWTHSSTNWTPGSGTRDIYAAFA